jgi:hypothetical protein
MPEVTGHPDWLAALVGKLLAKEPARGSKPPPR